MDVRDSYFGVDAKGTETQKKQDWRINEGKPQKIIFIQ